MSGLPVGDAPPSCLSPFHNDRLRGRGVVDTGVPVRRTPTRWVRMSVIVGAQKNRRNRPETGGAGVELRGGQRLGGGGGEKRTVPLAEVVSDGDRAIAAGRQMVACKWSMGGRFPISCATEPLSFAAGVPAQSGLGRLDRRATAAGVGQRDRRARRVAALTGGAQRWASATLSAAHKRRAAAQPAPPVFHRYSHSR